MSDRTAGGQRIDKWLWHARMLRTRSLAARLVASGKVRCNGVRVAKASQLVAPGDVLTFALNERVRVLRIVALAERRGPFAEACALYEDLSPRLADTPPGEAAPAQRPAGAGRPTKLERRRIGAFTAPGG
jgi:ribosome-associated heat shock protein Hsp15